MTWTSHLRPALAGPQHLRTHPPPRARARLHANECPEPWPAEVMADLGRRLQTIELGRYPDGSGRPLRELLAKQHGCNPDTIVLGNGSDELISLLLTALAGRASEPSFMVIPSPTFVMYGHSARCLGVGVLEVPLTDALQLDEPLMNEALGVANGAAICFLARPNNPTSSLWDAAVIDRLIAAHPGTMFVLDEAYIRYSPGPRCGGREPARQRDLHEHAVEDRPRRPARRLRHRPGPAGPRDEHGRHPYNVSTPSL